MGIKALCFDYAGRISRIIEWENISWKILQSSIDEIVLLCDAGGEKENIGKRLHRAYINALRAFIRFADCMQNTENKEGIVK